MRILFMGTPEYAAVSLRRLYEDGHEICGVFTQPDKPKNRGHKKMVSPVKLLAQEYGTPVYQPVTLRDEEAVRTVKALSPELIAVVAYGKILPREILDLPPLGCVNIHGSLLPKYRGAAPIQWAVLRGERVTGVTAIYMSEEMDAGDIIGMKQTEIRPAETAGELFLRLQDLGAELLGETVGRIADGGVMAVPQDHSAATFAPPLDRSMSPIDWTKPAAEVINQVRGLAPWPAATAEICGTVFKIYAAVRTGRAADKNPGEIICTDGGGIEVACRDETIEIGELQAPGGKRMAAADYLRGHPLCL